MAAEDPDSQAAAGRRRAEAADARARAAHGRAEYVRALLAEAGSPAEAEHARGEVAVHERAAQLHDQASKLHRMHAAVHSAEDSRTRGD